MFHYLYIFIISATDNTKALLRKELDIRLSELEDKWHYTSLEKIFFEEKIYKELEQKHASWENVIEAIDKAFTPFKKKLKRAIEREDILKLTEKPVRRIYRLDINELIEQIRGIEEEIKQVKFDLEHLTEYAVAYFENLLKKQFDIKRILPGLRSFIYVPCVASFWLFIHDPLDPEITSVFLGLNLVTLLTYLGLPNDKLDYAADTKIHLIKSLKRKSIRLLLDKKRLLIKY